MIIHPIEQIRLHICLHNGFDVLVIITFQHDVLVLREKKGKVDIWTLNVEKPVILQYFS